jgi:hypothetical protein
LFYLFLSSSSFRSFLPLTVSFSLPYFPQPHGPLSDPPSLFPSPYFSLHLLPFLYIFSLSPSPFLSPFLSPLSHREIRGLAAFKTASLLQPVDPHAADDVILRFNTQLALKSRFKTELSASRGLHSAQPSGSSSVSVAASRSTSPARGDRDRKVPGDKDQDKIPDKSTLYDIALDVERKLRSHLEADVRLDSVSTGLLVKDMWRAGAAINMMHKEGKMCAKQEATVLRIIQLLCTVPSVCFTVSTVDCLIANMQWILVYAPFLGRVVVSEITATYVDTARRGYGMFAPDTPEDDEEGNGDRGGESSVHSGKHDLLAAGQYKERSMCFVTNPESLSALKEGTQGFRGANGPEDADPRPHESLTIFLEQLHRTDAFNISLSPLFQCVSTLLCAPLSLSTRPNSVACRFRLLSLAMRLVRHCLTIPGAPCGPLRRTLRERAVRSCLSYFEVPSVWVEREDSPGDHRVPLRLAVMYFDICCVFLLSFYCICYLFSFIYIILLHFFLLSLSLPSVTWSPPSLLYSNFLSSPPFSPPHTHKPTHTYAHFCFLHFLFLSIFLRYQAPHQTSTWLCGHS